MTRAQDVRAMTNGWFSSPVTYGTYTGRGNFKEREEGFADQFGQKLTMKETTLSFDPTQLPIVQDSNVVITKLVDGVMTDVTYAVREVRSRGEGLLCLAILAKA